MGGLAVPPLSGTAPNPAAEIGFGTELPCRPEGLLQGSQDEQLQAELDIALSEGRSTSRADLNGVATRWAQASANWTNATLNGSYVTCVSCADKDGNGLGTSSFRVYLPRPSTSLDPNVRSGNVISYALDAAGVAFAVSDYLDDAIGTIKMWDAVATIPAGWTELTGAAGRFLVGRDAGDAAYDTPAETGGAVTHTHAAAVTGADGTGVTSSTGLTTDAGGTGATGGSGILTTDAGGTGATGSSTTGVTTQSATPSMTFNGDAHSHSISVTTGTTDIAAGLTVVTSVTTPSGATNCAGSITGGAHTHTITDTGHTHTGPSHTHDLASHTHTGPSHTHTIAAHTHTGPSHTHTIPETAAGTHTPKYYTVLIIKRTS